MIFGHLGPTTIVILYTLISLNLTGTFYLVVLPTFLKCFLCLASKPPHLPGFSPTSLPSISVFSPAPPGLSNLQSLCPKTQTLNGIYSLFAYVPLVISSGLVSLNISSLLMMIPIPDLSPQVIFVQLSKLNLLGF